MVKTLKYVGLGGVILLVLLITWGLIEPRFLARESIDGPVAELPPAWEGARVVQLSDWQFGMMLDNAGTVENAVEATVAVDPALAVWTGDFVYGDEDDPVEDYERLTRLGKQMENAGIPVYAVLGNHDYRKSEAEEPTDHERARQVRRALEQGGVRVLENEAARLDPPERAASDARPMYLVGIGSRVAGRARPKRALTDVPDGASRLVIMHHPDTFARLPAESAPLAVAGHTHGGQMRLPGLPSFSWITLGKDDEVHTDGWIEADYGAAGNRLYVNRGIGMSLIPLRINCMPEMTVIRLHQTAQNGP